MTIEDARKMLTNTKVYVNGKSKEIQEKLFEIGFSWVGRTENYIINLNAPFLFIGDKITCCSGMQSFANSELNEVSSDYILNIKLDEGFVPKRGDIIFVDTELFEWISIFNDKNTENILCFYNLATDDNGIYGDGSKEYALCRIEDVHKLRIATDEEKYMLFSALKEIGLVWNEKAKEIETIEKQKKEHEFKPFDKVLGRDSEEDEWNLDLFGNFSTEKNTYSCVGGYWKICITYKGNEELLGTSNSPEE